MANGMRKLLKYMKKHPPKNVELQRINVLEAENARLREALGWISTLSGETCVHAGHTLDEIYAVAQTALAGPEEKESKENPIRANFPPFDHRNLGKRGEE